MQRGIGHALGAAILFGASTPLAKLLTGDLPPLMLAGLLYLGSGLGLLAWFLLRAARGRIDRGALLRTTDLRWLAGAVFSGGVAGPALLMMGLTVTPAASASLLLNLEGVLTALLAWWLFHEHADRRIVLGMACIVAGGVLLSWQQGGADGWHAGALLIAAACLCWAIDNNLTRRIAASDAVQIAGIKGLVAGAVNLALALLTGARLPEASPLLAAAAIGFAGYGVSLVLFVLALRQLGAARTGAYFSTGPFAGAALSLLLFGDRPGLLFWCAAVLMGAGIWLHVSERHAHAHQHDPLDHAHPHVHDEHHQHAHPDGWDGTEPHSHEHHHSPLTHSHPHFPDIHHRHRHRFRFWH